VVQTALDRQGPTLTAAAKKKQSFPAEKTETPASSGGCCS